MEKGITDGRRHSLQIGEKDRQFFIVTEREGDGILDAFKFLSFKQCVLKPASTSCQEPVVKFSGILRSG